MPNSAAVAAAAPDYGSWADWVSGMGSLAAVIAALIIAWVEWRRSKKADEDRRIAEIEREARVRGHLRAIIVNLKEVCNATAAHLANEDREEHAQVNLYRKWLGQIREAGERLARLGRYPTIPLDLYLECDRVQAYLELRNFNDRVSHSAVKNIEDLAEKLERAEQRLTGHVIAGD